MTLFKPSQDPNEHGIFIVANEVQLNRPKYSTLKKNIMLHSITFYFNHDSRVRQ